MDILENMQKVGTYYECTEYIERFSEAQKNLSICLRKFEFLQSYSFLKEKNFISYIEHRYDDFAIGLRKFYESNVESSERALKSGIERKRLRFIKHPISDYIEFQYYSYLVWEKLGYKIRYFDDTLKIQSQMKDFIIFDNSIVFVLDFSENELLGAWESTNTELIKELVDWYDKTFNAASQFQSMINPMKKMYDFVGGFNSL